MLMRTGNIVTDCWIVACGSIFSTVPTKGRSGKASTVTFAIKPGRIFPMSVSFTSARTRTFVRSAILMIVVPPLSPLVPDAITCPRATGFSMTVPATGSANSRLIEKLGAYVERGTIAQHRRICDWRTAPALLRAPPPVMMRSL
jgi:hypothetical protein